MLSFFDDIYDNKPQCPQCKLGVRCLTPVFPVYGTGRNGIMLVMDNPNYEDEVAATPLHGEAGYLLKRTLEDLGVEWGDCKTIHAVNCNANGHVTKKHVQYCRPYTIEAIKEFEPKVIVTFGTTALQCILGYFNTSFHMDMDLWDGIPILCREFNCWIVPMHSPQYVIDCERDAMVQTKFREYLKQAYDLTTKSVSERTSAVVSAESRIVSPCVDDTIDLLEHFSHKDMVAFDYETTGLKPDADAHRIVSMALSDGDSTFAFMMTPELVVPVKRFLKSPCKKIAANYKFEENWSRVKIGTSVNNWYHDTMLWALCELNRPGITSLKFQAFTKFGVVNYNKDVDELLKAESSNGLNKIDQIPPRILLKYNALDALYEYHLAINQRSHWE